MISIVTNRLRRAFPFTRSRARMLAGVVFAGAVTFACDVHKVAEPGTLASITVGPNCGS